MEVVLALVTGGLYAAGTYLILRRSVVKLILGLTVLSHASNLFVFTAGRLTRAVPPLVPPGETGLEGLYADPLPQALVLTAIVIGFGVQAFAIVLLGRVYQSAGTDDFDAMDISERA